MHDVCAICWWAQGDMRAQSDQVLPMQSSMQLLVYGTDTVSSVVMQWLLAYVTH